MGYWENVGKSDEWYTPKYIFDAMDCRFDLDVAAARDRSFCHVPAANHISENSLEEKWFGFVWMNPPFGGRNSIAPWLSKIFTHGSGVALTPDRTSTKWWQLAYVQSDARLFVRGKIKFIAPDGTFGNGSPSNGTTLFGYGLRGLQAIQNAEKYGLGEASYK